jgi:large subunit ribosomal protein L31e
MIKETKQEQDSTEDEEQEETAGLVEEEPIQDLPEEEVEEEKEVAPVKEEKPKKKKKDENIVEERFYTIPLSRATVRPPKKRAPRAIQLVRAFITRHMKMETSPPEDETEELPTLTIDNTINEKVWDRGIEKPPRKIKVRVTKDKDGNVAVYLA